MWVTGLSWMALTVVQESFFHAPANAGPGYPAEVRSDLITRLVPCATLLIFDALRSGRRSDMRPGLAPERPGMPFPIGLEIPPPRDEAGRGRDPALQASLTRHPFLKATVASALEASGMMAIQVPSSTQDDSGADPNDSGPGAPCTASLLFQGSTACSWDLGRPQTRWGAVR